MARLRGPSERTIWRILTGLFVLYAGVTFGRLVFQEYVLLHKDKVLRKEHVHVLEKRHELLTQIHRANTPVGVERLAREKLGLVRAGEIPIKIIERSPEPTASQNTMTRIQ